MYSLYFRHYCFKHFITWTWDTCAVYILVIEFRLTALPILGYPSVHFSAWPRFSYKLHFPAFPCPPPQPPARCFSYPFHFGYASFQFISATLLHPNHVISPISHHYWAACLLGCLCGPVIKWAFGRLRRKTASRGREDTRVWYRETMFSQMVSCDFLLDEPLHGYFL